MENKMNMTSLHLSKELGLGNLPGPDPEDPTFATVFRNEASEVIIYAPKDQDLQEPHDRDEFYVVVSGSGEFINGKKRHNFETGDIIFVPAHQPHRFVNFTEDLVVWVIFYGPTEDSAYFSE